MIKFSFKLAKLPRCCCPRKLFLEIRHCATTRPTHALIQSSTRSSFSDSQQEWFWWRMISGFKYSSFLQLSYFFLQQLSDWFAHMFATKILLLLSKCISIGHAGFNYSDYIWTFGSIYLFFKFSEVQTKDNFYIKTQRKLWVIVQIENCHSNVVIQVGFLEYWTSWRLNTIKAFKILKTFAHF